jgi:hypothetical protein
MFERPYNLQFLISVSSTLSRLIQLIAIIVLCKVNLIYDRKFISHSIVRKKHQVPLIIEWWQDIERGLSMRFVEFVVTCAL